MPLTAGMNATKCQSCCFHTTTLLLLLLLPPFYGYYTLTGQRALASNSS